MFKWIAASINTYLAQYKAMRGHSRLLCSQTVILNVNYGFEFHNKTSLNFLPFTHLFTQLFLPDTSVSWLMLVPSRPTRTPKLWQKREWNTEMKTVHSSRLQIVICGTPLLCLYLYFNTIYIIIIYKHRYQLTACKPLAIDNRKHHNGRQSNLHYWVKQQT